MPRIDVNFIIIKLHTHYVVCSKGSVMTNEPRQRLGFMRERSDFFSMAWIEIAFT